jgi:hypothetical protein
MDDDAFGRELLRRSPLAACVLEACDFVFDPTFLTSVWDAHRGRCYEDVLTFADFLRLTRDALVRHGGSAHAHFLELERRGEEPVDESNYYRKLARTPVGVSRALLREGSRRVAELLPEGAAAAHPLPACFDGFAVVVGDGKKVKNAAKRLKPTRGYSGSLIGAKALVAMDARTGMAVAMSDSLDGEANDVPLVPALMRQLREAVFVARPILSVWDRQFDNVATMADLSSRPGDAFVVRMTRDKHLFAVESTAETVDPEGRAVRDEVGLLGKKAARVRRVTLVRGGTDKSEGEGEGEAEDVVLLTDLLDRAAFPAADLLALYRRRWGIEQVFQQVTETFALDHLIGSGPRAVLLQFAYCLLLYDLVQLVKAYVAADGDVLASVVSTYYLFADVRRELVAWAYHGGGGGGRTRVTRDAAQMRQRLGELLRGSWDPIAYTKASDKRPRPQRAPPKRLVGGHSSVQRLLEGKAKVIAE